MSAIARSSCYEIAGVPHYVARAKTQTTAGVLLLPHFFGIDEHMRGIAGAFAERGLTTLIWNIYHPHVPMGGPVTLDDRPPRPDDETAMAQLATCVDAMQGELGLTRVGTIGFCMGGRYALLFGSREPRLRAVVPAYPSIPPQCLPAQSIEPVPAAAAVACPVHVFYPGKDYITHPHVFRALQDVLQGRTADTTITVFPDAEHGFMSVPGPHNERAASILRRQAAAFLETCLLNGDER